MEPISLYFHIPFCLRRCGYCDFNTFAGVTALLPQYMHAMCQEMSYVLKQLPEGTQVHTVYFGGGTPSLVSTRQYRELFDILRSSVNLLADAEISLEANPGSVTDNYLQELREIGFNRISFGMQSALERELRILNRQHSYGDVLNAVKWSKLAGFERINLDLIFGIPGQTVQDWMRSLEAAMRFNIDHLSIYSLIVEEGTPLKLWIERGLLNQPDEDVAGEIYECTIDYLSGNGFIQYEISNWSRDEDSRCLHNLQYWHYLPYLGFGAGAHGFWGQIRTENVNTIGAYVHRIKEHHLSEFPAGTAISVRTRLSDWERMQENMMVTLRLTEEGVSCEDFRNRFGVDMRLVFDRQITRLMHWGLVEWAHNEGSLRLTRRGMLMGNRVFLEFVGNRAPAGYEHLEIQYT